MFRTTLDKLTAIRDEKKTQDGGFTLIELLVVVVIIGILIAIAIPLYLNYEHGAKDKSAASDLRAAISDINNCYSSNNNTYPASATVDSTTKNEQYAMSSTVNCTTETNLSSGTTLTYAPVSSGTPAVVTGFKLLATNSGGSGVYYHYNSTTGSGVTSDTTNSIG